MINNKGSDVSLDEMKRAVRQAIQLNDYLLRRAWGILFIAVAFSMSLSIFGAPILQSLISIGVVGAMALNMTASGCAIISILWAFKRVRYTAEVTHLEGIRAWSTLLGYRFLVPLWIAINAVAITTIAFAEAEVPLTYLLIHLGLAVYLYYALKLSFSKKLPGEAVIAIVTLSLSCIASISLLSIRTSSGPFALLWGATVVVWIFSGVFARTRPIPEFEEERTGLE